jgi:hypothetical protein
MTMRALGTCRNQVCQQTDLLWADGYCSEDCREQATGCPVPCNSASTGPTECRMLVSIRVGVERAVLQAPGRQTYSPGH